MIPQLPWKPLWWSLSLTFMISWQFFYPNFSLRATISNTEPNVLAVCIVTLAHPLPRSILPLPWPAMQCSRITMFQPVGEYLEKIGVLHWLVLSWAVVTLDNRLKSIRNFSYLNHHFKDLLYKDLLVNMRVRNIQVINLFFCKLQDCLNCHLFLWSKQR